MDKETFTPPDKNGIIKALPPELSEENLLRLKKFGFLMFLYDFAQDYFVRPRLHKADSQRHHQILNDLISQGVQLFTMIAVTNIPVLICHIPCLNRLLKRRKRNLFKNSG